MQMISLSPIEMCSVVEHARTAAGGNKLNIYHDPGVGTPYALAATQMPLCEPCKLHVVLTIMQAAGGLDSRPRPLRGSALHRAMLSASMWEVAPPSSTAVRLQQHV